MQIHDFVVASRHQRAQGCGDAKSWKWQDQPGSGLLQDSKTVKKQWQRWAQATIPRALSDTVSSTLWLRWASQLTDGHSTPTWEAEIILEVSTSSKSGPLSLGLWEDLGSRTHPLPALWCRKTPFQEHLPENSAARCWAVSDLGQSQTLEEVKVLLVHSC